MDDTQTPENGPNGHAAHLRPVDLADEMRDGFIPYSLSVITARAIPDARDGLKPVQRRTLYAMHRLGLRPGQARRKSAGVVGEVMGKYHPHGDSAIYESMVRMGQAFAMSVPLVDGKGNFGSLDDPPAAYRYTEARLAAASDPMLAGIDEDAVEMVPTFDGARTQPECLPSGLPNLLVNGASGIAVGMATSIPPHNLGEVVEAVAFTLRNLSGSDKWLTAKLAEIVPGPDFPSGGVIVGTEGIAAAYGEGKGGIKVRAKAEVVKATAKRDRIVVTELPYMVGPERVCEQIAKMIENDKLPEVSSCNDLSDRSHGLRLVIECKPGRPGSAVLERLWSVTSLEDTFSANCVALSDGQPVTMTLGAMCSAYAEHRLSVVVRRAEHALGKARERAHILEGLLAAVGKIREVVDAIAKAKSDDAARKALKRILKVDDDQAEAILDMRLRRVSALEGGKLKAELKEKQKIIADRQALLDSPQRQRKEAEKHLRDAAAPLVVPRRTEIVADDGSTAASGTGAASTETSVTPSGKVKYGAHKFTASPPCESQPRWAVFSDGTVRQLGSGDPPQASGKATAVGLLSGSAPAMVAASDGSARLIAAGGWSDGDEIRLPQGVGLVAAFDAPEGCDFLLLSSRGQALRTPSSGWSEQRAWQGRLVAGMKLATGDRLLSAGPASEGACAVWVSGDGKAKCVSADDIPLKGRATGGVIGLPKKAEATSGYAGPHPAGSPSRGNPTPLDPTSRGTSMRDGDFAAAGRIGD